MRTWLSPLSLIALLSLPVGACSGSAEPAPTRAARSAPGTPTAAARTIDLDRDGALGETDPSQATEFFVWAREDEERTLTYRLDARGRVVEALDGIVVATGAGIWKWQVEDRSIPTVPCEHYEDDEGHVFAGDPVEPGTATRASLTHLASGAEQIVVDPGVDLMGNADVQHDVGIVATIGPYVFIEESTYTYSCGAHGNSGVATMIWNAATGTTIAAPTDFGPLDAARQTAIDELTDDDDDAFVPAEDNLELTQLLPRFAPDGALELALQFTAPTCYACTRGGFSSYTKSTVVAVPTTPALLAPFVNPPPAVRAFLRTHPEVEMKGWSAR